MVEQLRPLHFNERRSEKERTELFFRSNKHKFAPKFPVNSILLQHLLMSNLITRYDDKQHLYRVISILCTELLYPAPNSLCWIEVINFKINSSCLFYLYFYYYSTALKRPSNSNHHRFPFNLLSCFFSKANSSCIS